MIMKCSKGNIFLYAIYADEEKQGGALAKFILEKQVRAASIKWHVMVHSNLQ